MRITELLKKESIELGVKVSDKGEAVDRLVSLMDAGGRLKDTAGYKEGILAREALGSTAIGEGIAIPHAKVEAVKEPGLAAMVVPEGVDYAAFDGSLANLLFMIAAPAEGADVHLEALSRLSTLLMNPGFKEGLMGAADKDEFLRIIDEAETERFGAPEGEAAKDAKADAEAGASSGYRVLAVTACPTGIAHTYMAAENLENTGNKLGIALKAETDGSGGARMCSQGKKLQRRMPLSLQRIRTWRWPDLTESLLSWSCGRRHPQGRGTDQTGCGRHGAGIPSYRSRGGRVRVGRQ